MPSMETFKREWRTASRFVIVGGTTILVKLIIYAVLSRYIMPNAQKPVLNVAAGSISFIYNYFLHRFWTFHHQRPAPGSMLRYAGILAVAAIMDAVLFYLGHRYLKIYDLLLLIADSAIVGLFTFTAHRFFTFKSRPLGKMEAPL
jgi:putative flippase GtrA